jgi:hypothetical protein
MNFAQINKNYFKLIEQNEEAEIYAALFDAKALKRLIKMVCVITIKR